MSHWTAKAAIRIVVRHFRDATALLAKLDSYGELYLPQTATLVSNKTLLPGVGIQAIRFRHYSAFKVLTLLIRHAASSRD